MLMKGLLLLVSVSRAKISRPVSWKNTAPSRRCLQVSFNSSLSVLQVRSKRRMYACYSRLRDPDIKTPILQDARSLGVPHLSAILLPLWM